MGKTSRILIGLFFCCCTYFVSANPVPNPSLNNIPDSSDKIKEFHNIYPDKYPRGSFIKWQFERLFYRSHKDSDDVAPSTGPNLELIHHPGSNVIVTWIGHSTLIYQCDGITFLTDPIFSDYASPLPPLGPKRHVPPGVSIKQLPHIDVVLISHNHYDHLDLPSVRALANQAGGPPLFLVPMNVRKWFLNNIEVMNTPDNTKKVIEFNWNKSISVPGKTNNFDITFLSVHHWSARSLWDRDETLWGSWAIVHPEFKFWFSGDLGYSKDSVDIGNRFQGFDLAAIDIGAYKPRWFMANYHLNPQEAVQVMKDVRAKQAIGIHWGVFKLSDEPFLQPPVDLKNALDIEHIDNNKFIVLKIGESKVYKEIN